MGNNIPNSLDATIAKLIEEVDSSLQGSAERSASVEELVKLYKVRNEEINGEREFQDRCERIEIQERELAIRRIQIDRESLDRWLKLGVDVLAVGLPLIVYAAFANKGYRLEFKENGYITSKTLKDNLSNIFRFKIGR